MQALAPSRNPKRHPLSGIPPTNVGAVTQYRPMAKAIALPIFLLRGKKLSDAVMIPIGSQERQVFRDASYSHMRQYLAGRNF